MVLFQEKRKSSDQELVNKILHGTNAQKAQAQEELFKFYYGHFNWYFYKSIKNSQEVEDLSVKTLSNAFLKIDTFDSKYAFSTWIQKIGTNLLIDHMRRRTLEVQSIESMKAFAADGDAVGFDAVDPTMTVDFSLERQEAHKALVERVDQLRPNLKIIVNLRFFEELSYEEIAGQLHLPIGTVKGYLNRAKMQLKEMI